MYIEVKIKLEVQDESGLTQLKPSIASFKSDAIVSYYKHEQHTLVTIIGAMGPFIVDMSYDEFKELVNR